MKNHFPVKIFPSDDLLVFYPAVLNPPEKVCKVTFGTMTIEAECRAHPKQQNILAISSKAAEKLNVDRNTACFSPSVFPR